MKRSSRELGARLTELAARHGLPSDAVERFERLLDALEAEAEPPTTVKDAVRAVDVHVADSLVALDVQAVRDARQVADIGAGAGFPGLALACALPDASVDLVESAGRKADVIRRLIEAAGLSGGRAVPSRAEEWAAGEGRERYDVVTARAVARLPVVLEYAAPLLEQDGTLVVWRGARDPAAEDAAEDAAKTLGLAAGAVLAVKSFAGAHSRHLHVYSKRATTPERFPRRPGVAAKRPLGRS